MEHKWNLTSLYSSDDAWSQEFNEFKTKSKDALEALKTIDFEKELDKVLNYYFTLERLVSKIYTYAHLKYDEDLKNNTYKEMYGKALFLMNDFQKNFCFLEPRILEIDESVFNALLDSKALKDYKFHLERIYRQKPHTLDKDKEELLALSGPALAGPSKAFSAFNNADLNFADIEDGEGEKKPLSHGLYLSYLRKEDRTLRQNAFEEVHNSYLNHENLLCELLSSQVNKHIFTAKARSYPNSLEAALFANNIDPKVYRNLISSVNEKISSLHDYISLRKKWLDVESLHPYDLNCPMIEDCKLEVEFSEGVDMVIESVAPLGKEYQEILRKGLKEERWVDAFETKGKRSGAYSSGCYDSSPYILMNYQNTLNDLFTLAHEAGHSMHSYLSREKQSYQYSQYSIFLAEIASTFNELLLLKFLRKKYQDNKELQLYLLLHEINFLRGTLFRQTQFAEFELLIHETLEKNTPLTPQFLKESYQALNEKYYGKDLESGSHIAIEWARIPHFYYNFYVYQYATGISTAYYFTEQVEKDPNAVSTYLEFLSLGGSEYPLDILKRCGADLVNGQVIHSALMRFKSLVGQLEKRHQQKNVSNN